MTDDYEPPEKRSNLPSENLTNGMHANEPDTANDNGYEPAERVALPPQLLAEPNRTPSSFISAGKTLADFLTDVKSVTPVIPDSVALYYMKKNGLDTEDPRIVRLISIATQKFISDIALDTMQSARMQGLGQVRKGNKDARFILNTELLEPVLDEYGIPFDHPSFYH